MTLIKMMMSIVEMRRDKWIKPLYECAFPPRADVCFEGKCWLISSQSVDYMVQRSTLADLQSETGNHQDQVIEKTAFSLDATAFKMLFVSVQQNNIDFCVRYAIIRMFRSLL